MFWPGGLVCLGELDLQLLCCSVLVIAILVKGDIMSKFAIALMSVFLANFLFSCAPSQGSSNPNRNDRVSESVINNLVANRWCQKNSTNSAIDYTWTFSKNLKATALAADATEETFKWSITNDNILTVSIPDTITTIFIKKVSYNYNVAAHKRTMSWVDPQAQQSCDNQGLCTITSSETVNFVECE
jgi:hypothetical protein